MQLIDKAASDRYNAAVRDKPAVEWTRDQWPGPDVLMFCAMVSLLVMVGACQVVQWIWSSLGRLVGGFLQ